MALDLIPGPVYQGDADAQAAEQGDVEQQVREVFIFDDGPVKRNHKHAVAELRHVPEDFTQIGQVQHQSVVRG